MWQSDFLRSGELVDPQHDTRDGEGEATSTAFGDRTHPENNTKGNTVSKFSSANVPLSLVDEHFTDKGGK